MNQNQSGSTKFSLGLNAHENVWHIVTVQSVMPVHLSMFQPAASRRMNTV